MMKAPGCSWEMWGGVIGITPDLVVYDGEIPVGTASDLRERQRRALAKYMIGLWTRFGEGAAIAKRGTS
jgi:hypothetical protein